MGSSISAKSTPENDIPSELLILSGLLLFALMCIMFCVLYFLRSDSKEIQRKDEMLKKVIRVREEMNRRDIIVKDEMIKVTKELSNLAEQTAETFGDWIEKRITLEQLARGVESSDSEERGSVRRRKKKGKKKFKSRIARRKFIYYNDNF